MRRREFIAGLGGAAAAWPLATSPPPALAQTPGRIYRLGHISNSPVSETASRDIILPELAKLGFVEGRNLVFDTRVGEADALPGLMHELLASRPDAIISVGPVLAAAGAATRNVPIVSFGRDPVELGLARSYARPGGNVTGVVILQSELEAKRLSILHEAVPDRRRVAVLVPTSAASATTASGEAALRKAAADLGVELLAFPAAGPADYPAAFAAMRAAGAQALLISATSEFFRDGKQLAALALEAQLPTVCEWADMAHMGCLIGYGANRTALRKRMANQIGQIFRGTAPGEIPIERPALFEFAINQKIAKSLGIAIPTLLLAQADEVIE
jgi:putative tryptophan/tyrosine transport system substrate-binding protein